MAEMKIKVIAVRIRSCQSSPPAARSEVLVSPLRPRSVDTASRSQPKQCKGFLDVNTAHRCGTWRMAQRADVMSVPRGDHIGQARMTTTWQSPRQKGDRGSYSTTTSSESSCHGSSPSVVAPYLNDLRAICNPSSARSTWGKPPCTPTAH